jgi:hypothetical protein
MSKEQALKELQLPLYDPKELKADTEYMLKKFGLTQNEFNQIMQLPRRDHSEFKTDTGLKDGYMNFLHKTAKIRRIIKSK